MNDDDENNDASSVVSVQSTNIVLNRGTGVTKVDKKVEKDPRNVNRLVLNIQELHSSVSGESNEEIEHHGVDARRRRPSGLDTGSGAKDEVDLALEKCL